MTGGRGQTWLARRARTRLQSSAHSASSTPGFTATSWLRRGSAHRLYSDPHAPALGSGGPEYHPAQPGGDAPPGTHRARFEGDVQGGSAQSPRSDLGRGLAQARISAWPVGSPAASRWLPAAATTRSTD